MVDALPTSPAMVYCEEIAKQLKDRIPAVGAPITEEAAQEIREILQDMEDRETYMQPDREVLGEAASILIPKVIQQPKDSGGGIVVIEHETLRALGDDWVKANLKDSYTDIGYNVHFRYFKDHLGGGKVLVPPSLFKTSKKVALNATAAMVVIMEYLCKAECISETHLRKN